MSLSPRGAPSAALADKIALLSSVLAKPPDLSKLTPQTTSSSSSSFASVPLPPDEAPILPNLADLPVNAPVQEELTSSGAVVNVLAPVAPPPIFSGGQKSNWREQMAAQKSSGASGDQSAGAGSVDWTATMKQRKVQSMLSARPLFSYFGGLSIADALKEAKLKPTDGAGPVKAGIVNAPSLKPIGGDGAAASGGGLGLTASFLTGRLQNLKRVDRPAAAIVRDQSSMPLWARAKPSEVRKVEAASAQIGIQPSAPTSMLQPAKDGELAVALVHEAPNAALQTAAIYQSDSLPPYSSELSKPISYGQFQDLSSFQSAYPSLPLSSPGSIVCGTCGMEILDDQSMEVNDKEFHLECVICKSCKLPLGEGDLLIIKDNLYHEQCVKCRHCERDLADDAMAVGKYGELYCSRHAQLATNDTLASVPCACCQAPIFDDPDISVAAIGDLYVHLPCACCAECKCSLLRVNCYSHGAYFYCEQDYMRLFALKCTSCNEYIEGPAIEIKNPFTDPETGQEGEHKYYFHPDHFTCNRDGADLRETGFIIHESELLCAECFEAIA